jgi:NTE family protein
MTRIGIALGGGGAKGLAHIPMLEALEELGVRPAMVSGTSIGAIVGALYASGRSAGQIRASIAELIGSKGRNWLQRLLGADIGKLMDFVDPHLGKGGFIKGEGFMDFLREEIGATRFEELPIPLKVVAADFWERVEVVFDSGDLLTALRASFSLPGLFSPLLHEGRVLIDGGAVNPVPFDLLRKECDLTIAVDVSGRKSGRETVPGAPPIPSMMEVVFATYQIMEAAIVEQKLRLGEPDLYLKPAVLDVRVLDFHKAERIYQQARPAKEELKRWLAGRLGIDLA